MELAFERVDRRGGNNRFWEVILILRKTPFYEGANLDPDELLTDVLSSLAVVVEKEINDETVFLVSSEKKPRYQLHFNCQIFH